MKFAFCVAATLSTFLPCVAVAADPVFQEKDGVIAMEAESTASRLGKWNKKTAGVDLAEQFPEKAEALRQKFHDWREDVDA